MSDPSVWRSFAAPILLGFVHTASRSSRIRLVCGSSTGRHRSRRLARRLTTDGCLVCARATSSIRQRMTAPIATLRFLSALRILPWPKPRARPHLHDGPAPTNALGLGSGRNRAPSDGSLMTIHNLVLRALHSWSIPLIDLSCSALYSVPAL